MAHSLGSTYRGRDKKLAMSSLHSQASSTRPLPLMQLLVVFLPVVLSRSTSYLEHGAINDECDLYFSEFYNSNRFVEQQCDNISSQSQARGKH